MKRKHSRKPSKRVNEAAVFPRIRRVNLAAKTWRRYTTTTLATTSHSVVVCVCVRLYTGVYVCNVRV